MRVRPDALGSRAYNNAATGTGHYSEYTTGCITPCLHYPVPNPANACTARSLPSTVTVPSTVMQRAVTLRCTVPRRKACEFATPSRWLCIHKSHKPIRHSYSQAQCNMQPTMQRTHILCIPSVCATALERTTGRGMPRNTYLPRSCSPRSSVLSVGQRRAVR